MKSQFAHLSREPTTCTKKCDNLWRQAVSQKGPSWPIDKISTQKPCNFTGPSKSLFWWHQGVRNLQPCVADGPRYSQNIPSRVLLTHPVSWCKVEHGTGSEPCHRVTTQNVPREPTGKNGQISATFGSWAKPHLPSRQVSTEPVCTKWYSGTRGHTLVTFAATLTSPTLVN